MIKFLKDKSENDPQLILPLPLQIKAWRRANRKMAWGIQKSEFDQIEPSPWLTDSDRHEGFIGAILCYGFGDDGSGHADSIRSGKLVWDYACKCRKKRAWQCEYIDFDKKDYIRLRPGAPPRPKGFYFVKFCPGDKFQTLNVSQFRKILQENTGCGPEGIQFLAITHTHFPDMMSERKIPFMALADYDVAPYGFNDFFDAPQLFSSKGILGLGIGNIDGNYPLFGIPSLRF
ncbi:MAG TPA: hypothetical protein ENI07_19740 [Desulfobacterales bacterium]|nr:hypothetical protein [Desulfobacterales bacterium]